MNQESDAGLMKSFEELNTSTTQSDKSNAVHKRKRSISNSTANMDDQSTDDSSSNSLDLTEELDTLKDDEEARHNALNTAARLEPPPLELYDWWMYVPINYYFMFANRIN